jgi:pyruvate,orthophosphate dikinase
MATKKATKKAVKTAKTASAKKTDKRVFFFGGGKAEGMTVAKTESERKMILGGKGAGLADMTAAGLPVPPGFTISVCNCEEYYKLGRKMSTELKNQVRENMAKVEKAMGKTFGDINDPLLVSVRSGAARSMPGMMETILNLGLNDKSVEGLAKKTGNPRFAYDASAALSRCTARPPWVFRKSRWKRCCITPRKSPA